MSSEVPDSNPDKDRIDVDRDVNDKSLIPPHIDDTSKHHRSWQTGKIPMDAGRKLIIALLVTNIALSLIIVPDVILSHNTNVAITSTLSNLLNNQQRLVADDYLATSSNNLLLSQEKSLLQIIGNQHNTTSALHKIQAIQNLITSNTPTIIESNRLLKDYAPAMEALNTLLVTHNGTAGNDLRK